MISEKTLKHATWLENVALRCILSEYYFELTTGHEGKFWPIVQNSLGEGVCVLWAHVFGNRKDDLHYKKFFSLSEVTRVGEEFQAEKVKQRILNKIGMSEEEYRAFWQEVKDCRDQFVAHKQIEAEGLTFPHIHFCREMMEEIRLVLELLFKKWKKLDPSDNEAENWVEYYAWNPNRKLKTQSEEAFSSEIRGLAGTIANK